MNLYSYIEVVYSKRSKCIFEGVSSESEIFRKQGYEYTSLGLTKSVHQR